MPNTSRKEFLCNEPLSETGIVDHTTRTVDQTILTVPSRLADSSDKEFVDIGELDLQDFQRIRNEDPFMYYSIVQHVRKMRSSGFVFDLDGVDDDLGWPGPHLDCAPHDLNPGTNIQEARCVHINRGNAFQASDNQASSTPQQPITKVTPVSLISQQVPSFLTPRCQGLLSQGVSVYTTGIIARKSRLSVEADCRKEMAALVASFPTIPCSGLASMFEWDNGIDCDLDAVDMSLLGLK